MRIKTKMALRDYIKRKLGFPLLRVELTEDMLNDCIERAIEVYSEYAYDGTSIGSVLLDLSEQNAKNTENVILNNEDFTLAGGTCIILPDNVISITSINTNTTPLNQMGIPKGYSISLGQMNSHLGGFSVGNFDVQSMISNSSKMSSLTSMFNKEVNFEYNWNSKILKILEDVNSNTILLEVGLDYEPMEVDNIYNNQWIKKRAEGEAWMQLSTITGKYSSSLVNGTEINYADMLSKGERIIDKTDEELDGLFEALGVYVF